jgi:hypothetical protein
MEDRDFFDTLYQGWSQTTGAGDTYWMPEIDGGEDADSYSMFNIYAVDQEQKKRLVAMGLEEADAGWITALHGCFADLVRRLHIAVDLAEQKDVERDMAMGDLFEALNEKLDQQATIEGLGLENAELRKEIDQIRDYRRAGADDA